LDALSDRLAQGLAALDRERLRRRRRTLDAAPAGRAQQEGRALRNFASNDYLGLSRHPALAQAAHAAIDAYGTGAGASALVTGHQRAHEEAEVAFARFVGMPRALLFASGYAANLGLLAALGDRGTEIFGDRLNHACLVDGALLSRATFTRYAHCDAGALEQALKRSTAPARIVATDAVFSMDGDVAPLREMLALCERYDAWLVVDDAHGIGVLGPHGRGTLADLGLASPRLLLMATLGKALGGYGAFVAGPEVAIEWLLQRARTYVFSTALPPAVAAAARAAIESLEGDDRPVRVLASRIVQFRGLTASASRTAIHPFLAGSPEAALAWSQALEARGFLVPAIRPPTVPQGTSRLRVSLSAAHSEADIAELAQAIEETRPR
jgi:8-amino-7-oxononanoate synthase